METAVKVSTSFRLNAELVEKMKLAAKASNRSLNNFVESILLNVMYHDTAESTTMAAIRLAPSGRPNKSRIPGTSTIIPTRP